MLITAINTRVSVEALKNLQILWKIFRNASCRSFTREGQNLWRIAGGLAVHEEVSREIHAGRIGGHGAEPRIAKVNDVDAADELMYLAVTGGRFVLRVMSANEAARCPAVTRLPLAMVQMAG